MKTPATKKEAVEMINDMYKEIRELERKEKKILILKEEARLLTLDKNVKKLKRVKSDEKNKY